MAGSNKKIHLCEIFQASGFFRVPKPFGHNEFFFSTFWRCLKWSGSTQISKMPKIIENQDLPRVPKLFGHKWFYFSTFTIFVGSLNFQNCMNFFKHPGKNFSQIFSSIGIFQVPSFFSRSEFFSTYTICPIIFKQNKILKNCLISFLKYPGKHLWGILQSAQGFGQNGKFLSFPKLPKRFFIVWKIPQCERLNIVLNQPHHIFYLSSLCEQNRG